jgi:hypothetical protein
MLIGIYVDRRNLKIEETTFEETRDMVEKIYLIYEPLIK